MDIAKFTKVMMLTQSNVDGEALAAVRMANKLLMDTSQSWESVFTKSLGARESQKIYNAGYDKGKLDGRAEIGAGPEKTHGKPLKGDADIEKMLAVCLEKVHGEANSFIESLADQFEERGSLSPKQVNALKKFYQHCH